MRLLLLGGTPEAVQIGQALAREDRVSAVASVARASRYPASMNLPMRIGGWGGAAAFRDWMVRERINAVLDATHPFATRISERTAEVADELGVPFVQFLRPAWTPGTDDRWRFLNDEGEAADHIPARAIVLLNTGRRNLERFAGLDRGPIWVRVAEFDGTPFPFREGGFLHRPSLVPVPSEVRGLRALGVEWLVVRNSGGSDGAALIEAARRLQLPVGVVRRPPQPDVTRIQTVAEALAWVRRRL